VRAGDVEDCVYCGVGLFDGGGLLCDYYEWGEGKFVCIMLCEFGFVEILRKKDYPD
jgi:hypothetical protein